MRARHRKYALSVVPRDEGGYGVALRQHGEDAPEEGPQIVAVHGVALEGVIDRVLLAIKSTGSRASALRADRKDPFILDEETGIRLGLLMLAIRPLRKPSRIMAMSNATTSMTTEEAYYWFSRCADVDIGRRARRALRVLLAEA